MSLKFIRGSFSLIYVLCRIENSFATCIFSKLENLGNTERAFCCVAEGGREEWKVSAPFLAQVGLVQAVNAAISRLGKHPASSSKF